MDIIQFSEEHKQERNKQISHVMPNLYVGNEFAGHNKELLTKLNIKCIVCIGSKPKYQFEYEYHIVHIFDKDGDIIYEINDASDYIHSCITNNICVLVHCQQGMCRAPTFVIGYLIKYQGLTFNQSMSVIKNVRPLIRIRSDFIIQLKKLEVEFLNI
jgi:protein-tyrosine phosphatase